MPGWVGIRVFMLAVDCTARFFGVVVSFYGAASYFCSCSCSCSYSYLYSLFERSRTILTWRKELPVTGWPRLPPEVRSQILRSIVYERHSLTRYALVCREWQRFIEAHKFSHVRIHDRQLRGLERRMVDRQRRLVRHIWLNIELREYTCWECDRPETEWEQEANGRIIGLAVERVFAILSGWRATGRGLTLEISVQSPSDTLHWFPAWFFGGRADVPRGICIPPCVLREQRPKPGGWGWYWFPDYGAVSRIWDQRSPLRLRQALPTVAAVTRLVMRRQSRRRFAATTLGLMLQNLPALEDLVYEPWRAWNTIDQAEFDHGEWE
ncbi:hypothetical protein UVI_02054750 [Ustilaginoidea virens]|uniref:F-box domain-containing protein n=1 Tax=Ustilaginoidea virens TaxID=1159556 RepID=A0A1B5L4T0_USTVR|nr:hypothetical protein UVI_02054750 [Ustilaginoidea virens]